MVTIVGAGFSGLTLGYELVRRGVQVRLLEKSNRTGGLISTRETPFGPAKTAAPSFNRTERVEAFLRGLGLAAKEPSRESRRRYFYSEGQLRRWPLTLPESARLFAGFLWSRATAKIHPVELESVESWARRTLGDAAARKLVSTAFQGVYAASAEELCAELVIGPIFRGPRERFRGVIGVEGGMGRVTGALLEKILLLGGEVVRDANDLESVVAKAGTIVYCTPPRATAGLLASTHPGLSRSIGSIRMLPLISATAFFERPNPTMGFGCLVSPTSGLESLGILLNHRIFPGGPGRPSETWILGGGRNPKILEASDESLKARIAAEREKIFDLRDEILHVEITRWNEALPAYDQTLARTLATLRPPKGVYFHGNWTGAIGLSRILRSSQELAGRLAGEKS